MTYTATQIPFYNYKTGDFVSNTWATNIFTVSVSDNSGDFAENNTQWAIAQAGESVFKDTLFWGYSPTQTNNGANGLGLISKTDGINFEVNLWDETAPPDFGKALTAIGSYYDDSSTQFQSIGSGSAYAQNGQFLNFGQGNGPVYYYNSDEATSEWIQVTGIDTQIKTKGGKSAIRDFIPFTGWTTGNKTEGFVFYSNGKSNGGNNFYYFDGSSANQLNDFSGTYRWYDTKVLEIGSGSQGLVFVTEEGPFRNIKKDKYPRSGLAGYFVNESDGSSKAPVFFELPSSSATEVNQISYLSYLDANDRSSLLVANDSWNTDTDIFYNSQLNYYADYNSLLNKAAEPINLATLEQTSDGTRIGYRNYDETVIAFTGNGYYYTLDSSDFDQPWEGEWSLAGNFSADIESYGPLTGAAPTLDGQGMFIGYQYGSVQYYNGAYSQYLSYDGTELDQFDSSNGLDQITPWGDDNAVVQVYSEESALAQDEGQNPTYVVNFEDDPSSVENVRLEKRNYLRVDKTKYKKVIEGTGRNDKITGSSSNNFFNSESGNSVDLITGGGGADAYLYLKKDLFPQFSKKEKGSHLRITDFSSNDNIVISRFAVDFNKDLEVVYAGSSSKKIKAAKQGSDVIYNENNGKLYFNYGKYESPRSNQNESKHGLNMIARLEGIPDFSADNLAVL